MLEEIFKILNIDKNLQQERKVKSLFYQHEKFDSQSKRIFDELVENIKIIAVFNSLYSASEIL